MEPIKLNVNSENKSFSTDPSEPLLYILREEFGINSTKFGCGLQQCGACMVLLDGEAEPSCLLSCQSAQSKSIVTLEGLEKDGKLHPIQEAFIEAQAAQCGYCINGMIISAVALLRKKIPIHLTKRYERPFSGSFVDVAPIPGLFKQ